MVQHYAAATDSVSTRETLPLLARVHARPVRMFGPDRRNELSRQRLLGRVHGEFLEMRGLTLTVPQARRLFNLREDICARVLGTLVGDGVLRARPNGSFGLADV